MKTALAVSPHLDDAVFSAGALLARLASEGWRVVVATCFTASMPDPKGFALACQLDKGLSPDADYMALRRAEDTVACALLGCEIEHLPFVEAPHRGYESAPALFEPLLPSDPVAGPLSEALQALIGKLKPDLILGPAAIGSHVDHVIVRQVVERLQPPVKLWADLPYAARANFDRHGFEAIACESKLLRKIAASRCYTTQLGFQFGSSEALQAALQIDQAEWFMPARAYAELM